MRAQVPPRKSSRARRRAAGGDLLQGGHAAAAEDLARDVPDRDIDDDECAVRAINDDASGDERDGIIVRWTIKALDKNLDQLERTKPKQAEVAWRVASEAEKVVRSPTFQKGAKVTGDVGMGVIKAAAPWLAKSRAKPASLPPRPRSRRSSEGW